jgi:hypothetical protein
MDRRVGLKLGEAEPPLDRYRLFLVRISHEPKCSGLARKFVTRKNAEFREAPHRVPCCPVICFFTRFVLVPEAQ